MVYFSKIGETIFNLNHIIMIRGSYVILSSEHCVFLSNEELKQLLGDIDHAAMLVRIQQGGK